MSQSMIKLDAQLDELSQELDTLSAGEGTRQIIDQLDTAVSELEPEYEELERALTERRTLTSEPQWFQLGEFSEAEETLAQEMEECFRSLLKVWQKDASKVRQSGAVSEFRDAVQRYRHCVDRGNTIAWTRWRTELEKQFLIGTPELESVRKRA